MTPECRRQLLEAITKLCDQYPDWRFGQLVSNVAGWADVDTWDVEDEQLLAAAESHLEQRLNIVCIPTEKPPTAQSA